MPSTMLVRLLVKELKALEPAAIYVDAKCICGCSIELIRVADGQHEVVLSWCTQRPIEGDRHQLTNEWVSKWGLVPITGTLLACLFDEYPDADNLDDVPF